VSTLTDDTIADPVTPRSFTESVRTGRPRLVDHLLHQGERLAPVSSTKAVRSLAVDQHRRQMRPMRSRVVGAT